MVLPDQFGQRSIYWPHLFIFEIYWRKSKNDQIGKIGHFGQIDQKLSIFGHLDQIDLVSQFWARPKRGQTRLLWQFD